MSDSEQSFEYELNSSDEERERQDIEARNARDARDQQFRDAPTEEFNVCRDLLAVLFKGVWVPNLDTQLHTIAIEASEKITDVTDPTHVKEVVVDYLRNDTAFSEEFLAEYIKEHPSNVSKSILLSLPAEIAPNVISTIVGRAIRDITLHPVRLELVWKRNPIFDLVVAPEITSLRGYSRQTGNRDARGGGCGNRGFTVEDFEYTMYDLAGITIRELAEVVYRLKGSKYDYWYELFSYAKFENLVAGSIWSDCIKETKELVFEVEFDYGS